MFDSFPRITMCSELALVQFTVGIRAGICVRAQAAYASVACVLHAVDEALLGRCANALCVVRPPGHHAGISGKTQGVGTAGFCFLNSVAIGAKHAVRAHGEICRKVAVVDFDVHHGNGTQEILCRDDRFLFCSVHAHGKDPNNPGKNCHTTTSRSPMFHMATPLPPSKGCDLYPVTGGSDENVPGRVLNVPLPAKCPTKDYVDACTTQVAEAIEDFRPDLVILSAGFDAHKNDLCGLGSLDAKDFGTITEALLEVSRAAGALAVVSVLEGGYGAPCGHDGGGDQGSLESFGECLEEHLRKMVESQGLIRWGDDIDVANPHSQPMMRDESDDDSG